MISKAEFFNKIVFDNTYSFKDIGQMISKGTNQIGEALKDAEKWTDRTPGKGKDPFKFYGAQVKKAINEGKFDSLLKTNQAPPRPTNDISPNF
jgi:hypothetical protein